MAATTSPSINSLVAKLQKDYPSFRFIEADDFRWSPNEATIYYCITPDAPGYILHELAHAILRHDHYTRDIDLLKLERDAWTTAQQLAGAYHQTIEDETVSQALDTYRLWLHKRSRCPECESTGIQVDDHTYRCPACRTQWRANDSRRHQLRRYKK